MPVGTWVILVCKKSRKGAYLTPDLESWQVESSNKLLDSGSETAEMMASYSDIEV